MAFSPQDHFDDDEMKEFNDWLTSQLNEATPLSPPKGPVDLTSDARHEHLFHLAPGPIPGSVVILLCPGHKGGVHVAMSGMLDEETAAAMCEQMNKTTTEFFQKLINAAVQKVFKSMVENN